MRIIETYSAYGHDGAETDVPSSLSVCVWVGGMLVRICEFVCVCVRVGFVCDGVCASARARQRERGEEGGAGEGFKYYSHLAT